MRSTQTEKELTHTVGWLGLALTLLALGVILVVTLGCGPSPLAPSSQPVCSTVVLTAAFDSCDAVFVPGVGLVLLCTHHDEVTGVKCG